MKDNEKQIQDWQEHVRETFGDERKLYEYLFETMDNFYYRYLETSISKNLKTQELGPKTYGAVSFETSMLEALKNPNPKAKPGIIELAKRVPRAENPSVRYGLWVEVQELASERGSLVLTAEINWGFPEFTEASSAVRKQVKFDYDDLSVFRKQLALKLEETCELFIS